MDQSVLLGGETRSLYHQRAGDEELTHEGGLTCLALLTLGTVAPLHSDAAAVVDVMVPVAIDGRLLHQDPGRSLLTTVVVLGAVDVSLVDGFLGEIEKHPGAGRLVPSCPESVHSSTT